MSLQSRKLGMLLLSTLVFILACNINVAPAPTQSVAFDPTKMALEFQATMMSQQLTQAALSAQMTSVTLPTQPNPPALLTQALPPSQVIPPSPIPTNTATSTPAPLVLDILTSVSVFYCYQPPYKLTITVKVSDINRGMAVYYHIQDKNSGVTSAGQVIDLHRRDADTRYASIIGGGSMAQNLQFPPMMGESYFIYQIISDDGTYRSSAYSNVTFFPCAQ